MSAVDSRPPAQGIGRTDSEVQWDEFLSNPDAPNPNFGGQEADFSFSTETSAALELFGYQTADDGQSTLALHLTNADQGPAADGFLQQTENLVSSHALASRTISPTATPMDGQLTPDDSFLSEAGYDISSFNSPSVFEAPLYDQNSVIADLDQLHIHPTAADDCHPGLNAEEDLSLANGSAMATPSTELEPPGVPVGLRPNPQLVTPSVTTASTPISNGDKFRNLSLSPQMSHYGVLTGHHRRSSSGQQLSPALTGSPGGVPLNGTSTPSQMLSPIVVRVERCSESESPSSVPMGRCTSKRSHGSRRGSATHLSPYPAESLSDDDLDHDYSPVRENPLARELTPPVQRADDGSWSKDERSGLTGYGPDDREKMKEALVPSIDDLAEQRHLEVKNKEVRDWLIHSEVGSDAGDPGSVTKAGKKKRQNRARAKSTSAVISSPNIGLGLHTPRLDDSGIPGPNIVIEEQSDSEDEEESDGDNDSDSPPAMIDVYDLSVQDSIMAAAEGDESPRTAVPASPWKNPSFDSKGAVPTETKLPETANAAITLFRQKAKDIDAASLAATIGTISSARRMSESDMGSVVALQATLKPKEKGKRERRPSFIASIGEKLPDVLRRSNSTSKRKGSQATQQNQDVAMATQQQKEAPAPSPKRKGSWTRPKSPRLDTNVQGSHGEGRPNSAITLTTPSGPFASIRSTLRRARSRSDIGVNVTSELGKLLTKAGGPPMPVLASPQAEFLSRPVSRNADHGSEMTVVKQGPVVMDLSPRPDTLMKPTYEGFKMHALRLNPRLNEFMLDRLAQEQVRRYKRLVEFRIKHLKCVEDGKCSSGKFCTALGGDSETLPPKAGSKDLETSFTGFQITGPTSSDDEVDGENEGPAAAAQFPPGVPLPPVKRLPAEFECPVCFKNKKFYKPSDWTKHVHEDIQPFTCTFPNCPEPKSFKRKADWVRHENERHRKLESWTCGIQDCSHVCHRKDNFVQHLVREHKIPEPKARTGRAANAVNDQVAPYEWRYSPEPTRDYSDQVWALVESCRKDTNKQPQEEACRFCGNILNTWKKLTVHLAKHMEQISMPILPLVEKKSVQADTVLSPIDIPQTSSPESKSPQSWDNPSSVFRLRPSPCGPSPLTSIGAMPPSVYNDLPQQTGLSPGAHQTGYTYPPPPQLFNPFPATIQHSANHNLSPAGQTYPNPHLVVGRHRQTPANDDLASPPGDGGSYAPVHPNGYPPAITPVPSYGSHHVYQSPVDTTYHPDGSSAAYFAQSSPSGVAMPGAPMPTSPDLGYDQSDGAQYGQDHYLQIQPPFLPQQPRYQ